MIDAPPMTTRPTPVAPDAVAVLRELEWFAEHRGRPECPVCTRFKDIGHAPDCRLSAALAAAEQPRPDAQPGGVEKTSTFDDLVTQVFRAAYYSDLPQAERERASAAYGVLLHGAEAALATARRDAEAGAFEEAARIAQIRTYSAVRKPYEIGSWMSGFVAARILIVDAIRETAQQRAGSAGQRTTSPLGSEVLTTRTAGGIGSAPAQDGPVEMHRGMPAEGAIQSPGPSDPTLSKMETVATPHPESGDGGTLEALRDVVREVEWSTSYYNDFGEPEPACPVCHEPKSGGHAPDCRLRRALLAADQPGEREAGREKGEETSS